MARRRSIWESVNESTEGPNVTIEIPREWAEGLMRVLATALELEDHGDEEDDIDMDADGTDDVAELDFSGADDGPDFAANDDDDDDSSEDEEEDDDTDEAVRPKTALGESSFSKLARALDGTRKRHN